MGDFLYPTQADGGIEWFANMLADWKGSERQYLCFPFKTFRPRTLPVGGTFWLYMYYRQGDTDTERLRGKVKFRIHVSAWSESAFEGADIHTQNFGGDEKVWFLCDKAEEIGLSGGVLLGLDHFEHTERKQLFSTIRTSIAPISCLAESVQVVRKFP